MQNPNQNTILEASNNQITHTTMEKKNTTWVVVTWDSESARLTSKTAHTSQKDAENHVYAFYVEAKSDENIVGAHIDDDKLFACCTINGRDEFCEAFEI